MQAAIDERLHCAMVHPECYDYIEPYQYYYGGRGGGKSKTVARIIPLLAWSHPNLVALVTRKTFPSLRITAMQDTLDAVNQMDIPGTYFEQKRVFEFINGSKIHFSPLYIARNRNERLKSFEYNVLWMEEPTECAKADFDNLAPARRLPGIHRTYFTFNPPETSEHWLYHLFNRQYAKKQARKVHFGLEENPLLPVDVRQELYDLKEIDIGLYKRFAEGEWGIDVKRKRVWTNIMLGTLPGKSELWFGGIDHGWNNPSSWHLYGLYDNDIYVVDEVYKSHMQPEEFGVKIMEAIVRNGLNPARVPNAADSEAPDKNRKLQQCGLWVIPAVKGKGSVEKGVVEVRRYKVYVDDEKCPNAWRELTSYIYPEDRDGKILEEPMTIDNHSCDDLRYAVMTILKQKLARKPQRPSAIDVRSWAEIGDLND